MSAFHISGSIKIESDTHTVEYEPGDQLGAQTLFLRLNDGDKRIPIFITHVDEVIEML